MKSQRFEDLKACFSAATDYVGTFHMMGAHNQNNWQERTVANVAKTLFETTSDSVSSSALTRAQYAKLERHLLSVSGVLARNLWMSSVRPQDIIETRNTILEYSEKNGLVALKQASVHKR